MGLQENMQVELYDVPAFRFGPNGPDAWTAAGSEWCHIMLCTPSTFDLGLWAVMNSNARGGSPWGYIALPSLSPEEQIL